MKIAIIASILMLMPLAFADSGVTVWADENVGTLYVNAGSTAEGLWATAQSSTVVGTTYAAAGTGPNGGGGFEADANTLAGGTWISGGTSAEGTGAMAELTTSLAYSSTHVGFGPGGIAVSSCTYDPVIDVCVQPNI